MSIEPNSRGAPSADTIKAYWEANPSQRKCEFAMRADGWQISGSSIIRCKRDGFAPRAGFLGSSKKSTKAVPTSPEAAAIRQVQKIAPDDAPPDVIAAALVERLRSSPDSEKDRIKSLLDMDQQELESNTAKLVRVARHLLAEDLAKHTNGMMLIPDKAAKLLIALESTSPTTIVSAIVNPGEGAKVIEHNPNEPQPLSPSAQALRDFRAKRASAAA